MELQRALDNGWDLVAPPFLGVEVMSVLRKHVCRGTVTAEQGEAATRSLLDLPIEEVGGMRRCRLLDGGRDIIR